MEYTRRPIRDEPSRGSIFGKSPACHEWRTLGIVHRRAPPVRAEGPDEAARECVLRIYASVDSDLGAAAVHLLGNRGQILARAAMQSRSRPYRKAFHEELIGALPKATEPLKARTVRLFDEPRWTGYAVELPVWPDVVASGILLLPKDLKPGERRPVIVCQHGLEGRPEDLVDPKLKNVYHAFEAQLADRGYIVYAPKTLTSVRKSFDSFSAQAQSLKQALFSVIVGQHERTLAWLSTLTQVDPKRIAFYGLSYGGKTAMRVPAILTQYCLSICSGDFNEWVVKNTNLERAYSYMFTARV